MSIQRETLEFPFDACIECGEKHIEMECPNPNPFLVTEPLPDIVTEVYDDDSLPTDNLIRGIKMKIEDLLIIKQIATGHQYWEIVAEIEELKHDLLVLLYN